MSKKPHPIDSLILLGMRYLRHKNTKECFVSVARPVWWILLDKFGYPVVIPTPRGRINILAMPHKKPDLLTWHYKNPFST